MTGFADSAIIAIIVLTTLFYISKYAADKEVKKLEKQFKDLGIEMPEDFFANAANPGKDDEELREKELFAMFRVFNEERMTTTELWRALLKRAKEEGDILFEGRREPQDRIIGNYLVRYSKYVAGTEEGLGESEAFGRTQLTPNEEYPQA